MTSKNVTIISFCQSFNIYEQFAADLDKTHTCFTQFTATINPFIKK